MRLIVTKIMVSIFFIVILTEISKRVNPVLGGLIAGLPLGTGLSAFFICYQSGIDYFISGVPWGIAGLASTILLCVTYLIIGKLLKHRLASIVLASLSGIILFSFSGSLIYLVKFTILSAVLFFGLFFLVNILIVNHMIIEKAPPKTYSLSIPQVIARGLFVGIILLLITNIALIAGSKWAGILSSFPSTLLALIIILHFEEGMNLYPSIIKGFSYGISTLALFYILCAAILPTFGLYLGFLVIYLISFVYLYCLNLLEVTVRKYWRTKL